MVDALLTYKQVEQPDDWVYYQLIRKTAQILAPKSENYYRYTLYKCFLLGKSGYGVALTIAGNKLLFFTQSNDEVYDIPSFNSEGKRFVCLNFHDYGYQADLDNTPAENVTVSIPEAQHAFSYKLTRLPDFRPESYHNKELNFTCHGAEYHFTIKLNDEVKKIFVNYPVADYQLYFNGPLSRETYNSLIPQLRRAMRHMSEKEGVDYLMHFTRSAFTYEADQQHFGREKHLSPEQTLLYDSSDCEDRSALFYCLVKEIYNLPMVVLAFPNHVTVGVKLDRPVGKQIVYNGVSYSLCEPTPQTDDLPIGAIAPELSTAAYEVAYCYNPSGQ